VSHDIEVPGTPGNPGVGTAGSMDAPRELHQEDRFTWERIVMRARLDGLIQGNGRISAKTGKQTRGGVSGVVFKAVALVFAAHADEDGSRIYPGDMRVALLAETSPRTVKVVREKLLSLGLLKPTGRHGRTPMYRLTLPDDLSEQVVVLTPDGVVSAAREMRSKARAGGTKSRPAPDPDDSDGCSGGPPNEAVTGVPEDHPNDENADADGWSSGHPENADGWSSGHAMGGPPDTLNHVRTRHLNITTEKSGVDPRTAVTHVAEPDSEEPEASVVVEIRPGATLERPHWMPPPRGPAAENALAEARQAIAAARRAQRGIS
jgi:hypothetical protein